MDDLFLKSADSNIEAPSRGALVAIYAAGGLDGCDDQMLPASFRAMEHDLNMSPTSLGKITFAQTLSLAMGCPIWGYLADRSDRKIILVTGTMLWGLMTIGISMAWSFTHILLLRILNGFFLASIGPISQAVIAENAGADQGFVFGTLQTCTNFGRIVGGVTTTAIGLQIFWGVPGWRLSIGFVGILSMILGMMIFLILPPLPPPNRPRTLGSRQFLYELWYYSLKVPSVVLLFFEGMVGTIPWGALSFLTMFFQYSGLSDLQAGFVTGSLLVGAMISGFTGGLIGDSIDRRFPKHGRPFIAQISMLIRIPLLITMFKIVPQSEDSHTYFFLLSLGLGLASFAGSAVNRPILTEVVPPQHRGTVFALLIAVEGIVGGSLGAPMVGFLAERVYGYKPMPFLHIDPVIKTRNSSALAYAMTWLTVIPWILSLIVYAGLHYTYGADRLALKVKIHK